MARPRNTEAEETVVVNFRISRVQRDAFRAICREKDQLMAQALRAYVVHCIETHETAAPRLPLGD